MNTLEFSIENLPVVLLLDDTNLKMMEEYISVGDTIPLSITIKNQDFVLLSEENFEELMEMDCETCYQEMKKEFCRCAEVKKDSHLDSDSIIASVMKLLREANLTAQQVADLTEVLAAHYTLAKQLESYGGEEK